MFHWWILAEKTDEIKKKPNRKYFLTGLKIPQNYRYTHTHQSAIVGHVWSLALFVHLKARGLKLAQLHLTFQVTLWVSQMHPFPK